MTVQIQTQSEIIVHAEHSMTITESGFDAKEYEKSAECVPVKRLDDGDTSQESEKLHGMLRNGNSKGKCGKSVSFAKQIVAEVRERPRTLNSDKSVLFYSGVELQRFRQEYRQLVYMNNVAKSKSTTVLSTVLSFAINLQNAMQNIAAALEIPEDEKSRSGTEEHSISPGELQEVMYLY